MTITAHIHNSDPAVQGILNHLDEDIDVTEAQHDAKAKLLAPMYAGLDVFVYDAMQMSYKTLPVLKIPY